VRAVRGLVTRLRALSPAASQAPAPGWEPLPPGTTVIQGEAGGPGEESWVRFHLLVGGDSVKEARFQAFGCPHTMDTAAWLCARLPGRSRAGLVPGTPAEWAAARQVPPERLGRMLVLEDALRACLSHWA
jgi:hypothetical protein